MKVTVTAEDIANGIRVSCSGCPIALALKRERNGLPAMFAVTETYVRFGDWPKPELPLSAEAKKFIADFDAGRPVQPATFELLANPEDTP